MTYEEKILAALADTHRRLDRIKSLLAEGGTIPRSDISLILPGQPYHNLEGSSTYRIETEDPNQVILFLIIKGGRKLAFHDHDCPERGTVIWGEIITNGARFGPFEHYRFGTGEIHNILAVKESGVLLEFPPKDGGNQKRPAR